MRVEAFLFGGMALFFAVVTIVYGLFSDDRAGTSVLTVSFAMSLLIGFYCAARSHRYGPQPQDRTDAEIADGAGPVAFFSPRSRSPLFVALAVSVVALGVVFGVWLMLLGGGLFVMALLGMVFQHTGHPEAGDEPAETESP